MTRRHIERINDITKAVNRGTKGSSSIYTAVKNRTLAEIKITVAIKVRPAWSKRILNSIGLEGELKKSQVKIVVLFSRKLYIRTGNISLKKINRLEPAFTGCHIKEVPKGRG